MFLCVRMCVRGDFGQKRAIILPCEYTSKWALLAPTRCAILLA